MCHFSRSADYPGEVLFQGVLDASHVKISLSMRPPNSRPLRQRNHWDLLQEASLKLEASPGPDTRFTENARHVCDF